MRFRDLSTAVWTFWMQVLPSSMLPGTVRGTEYLTEAEDGDPAFWAGEVYRIKKFLKHLAVMPIDKCQHRMLIEWPRLYEQKYVEAFSELVDPEHFEQVYDSVEEAEQFLRDSYNKAGWKGMGSWNHSGCIPEHYILTKYKDIVTN